MSRVEDTFRLLHEFEEGRSGIEEGDWSRAFDDAQVNTLLELSC